MFKKIKNKKIFVMLSVAKHRKVFAKFMRSFATLRMTDICHCEEQSDEAINAYVIPNLFRNLCWQKTLNQVQGDVNNGLSCRPKMTLSARNDMKNEWCNKLHPTRTHVMLNLFTFKVPSSVRLILRRHLICQHLKKQPAFTFAELMISFLVISVVAALLYPNLVRYTPNTNKPLFQSAYKTLNTVIAEIVNSNTTGELPNSANGLCQSFCEKVNPVGYVKDNGGGRETTCTDICNAYGAKHPANSIRTSNGMRWHFAAIAGSTDYKISVDVNASNNDLTSVKSGSDGGISAFDNKGVFTFQDTDIVNAGVYNLQNLKAQDTFWITIDKKGKIIDMSPAGWANLEDNVVDN